MPDPPFARDRVTVLAYAAVGAYAYYLYALGPVLAFLHDELALSYTMTSVHSALWAGGTVLTGVLFGALVRRFGRRCVLWGSVAGACAGGLLFSVSHQVGLTLLATGILGIAGSLVQAATTAILADRHGVWRERALVEGGVMAAGAAVFAPIVLGSLDRTDLGWRAGMLLPVIALGATWLVFRREPLPAAPPPPDDVVESSRLPRAYWPLAVLCAIVVGIEFSMVFYGAVLLDDDRGFSTADAATAMSVFYVGILAGRIAAAGLTRRAGRVGALLLGALTTTTAGFLVFWLSGLSAVAIAGLFVVGLGVANLYPLAVGLAVARAPGQTDQATARLQLLIGVAVIVAPLTLGGLADAVGVFRAFTVELILIGVATTLLVVSSLTAPSASPLAYRDAVMVASEELVVLLDEDRQPAGTMPKSQVHTADTPLHLAFSVYVFDYAGRLLVTRRTLTKPTWGGVWTNSCCGHPGPGEDITEAARRRLQQELGLTATAMDMVLPDFAYRATSAEGVVENEVCPVFVARVSGNPTPDPTEVTEWQWVDWPVFRQLALTAPWALSPWAAAQVAELPVVLP